MKTTPRKPAFTAVILVLLLSWSNCAIGAKQQQDKAQAKTQVFKIKNPDARQKAIKQSACGLTGKASAPAGELTLWYRQPARQWVEALPVGNGRLGAMVYGGVNREWLQLNEDTIWSGRPVQRDQKNVPEALAEARRLLFEQKYVGNDGAIFCVPA